MHSWWEVCDVTLSSVLGKGACLCLRMHLILSLFGTYRTDIVSFSGHLMSVQTLSDLTVPWLKLAVSGPLVPRW